MPNNVIRYADGRYPYAAGAAMEPGDVVVRPCGTVALFDGMFGAASGEVVNPQPLIPSNIVEFAATSGDTWSAGQLLFWDAVNKVVTTTVGANRRVGISVAAKTSGQTICLVNCLPPTNIGTPISLRTRVTIANVNAGATLVPAEAGIRYRLLDAAAIAIGGAAGAGTTVDILATQSASAVKLVAFAQASLTQNTLLRAGGAGAAILAGGVSFVQNDTNTALTIGKTGSDFTTATHIDAMLTYVREVA
jgi:hypothetical protein